MTYLVTTFAAAVTSLTGRWLWWTLVSAVRALHRLAAHADVVLLAVRALAAGGDVEWRIRRPTSTCGSNQPKATVR
ncbi:hypothetical protein [Amycolatopsis sp. cmx-4-68]|uniref:hypothetical protein n=1 Tax=Amycolatopsis sp. cmx-4-68 TaxID=2790938 RepID=UPI003979E934